jgi:hypothetical protein
MLPLTWAAQRAGHDVLVATGPDLVPGAERNKKPPVGRGSGAFEGRYLGTVSDRRQALPRSAPSDRADEGSSVEGAFVAADRRLTGWRP